MSKTWIFLGIVFGIILVIAIGCAVQPNGFGLWFHNTMLGILGQTWVSISSWWAGVQANPVYMQWHMLIWFVGGVLFTIVWAKVLWSRLPKQVKKVPSTSSLASKISLQTEPAEPEQAAVAPMAKVEEKEVTA